MTTLLCGRLVSGYCGIAYKKWGVVTVNVIEVKNLSKTFKIRNKGVGFYNRMKSIVAPDFINVSAVDNISFNVRKGEKLAFIGPNGAGKSTTIKMLTSILRPDAGSISVLGLNPIKKRKELAYRIGTVFGQKEQLWMHLSPYDNFKFVSMVYDLDKNKANQRIAELSAIFNLNNFIHTPVKNLSLGQRICCEIVASMIHSPEILFLDEPTIGLDPVIKEKVRNFIGKMNEEYLTTIFLTSHDIGDIERLCNRIIIMNKGRLVTDTSINDLKFNYLREKIFEIKTKSFVGIPSMRGLTVLYHDDSFIKAAVDTSLADVSNIIKLLDYDNIIDINIACLPLENIISDIYSSKERVVK